MAELPSTVATSVRENSRRESAGRVRVTEKADRATVEQALDPRTRLVLFKMLNQGVFNAINGCISTGKEANVYHATTAGGNHLAVKARARRLRASSCLRRGVFDALPACGRCTKPPSWSSRTATAT
jgi:serine/threonine-protein kinase RIO1